MLKNLYLVTLPGSTISDVGRAGNLRDWGPVPVCAAASRFRALRRPTGALTTSCEPLVGTGEKFSHIRTRLDFALIICLFCFFGISGPPDVHELTVFYFSELVRVRVDWYLCCTDSVRIWKLVQNCVGFGDLLRARSARIRGAT